MSIADEVILPPCSYCGNRVEGGLCFSHMNPDRDWPKSNKVWCDFFHRGIVPERVPDPLPGSQITATEIRERMHEWTFVPTGPME